MKWQAELSSRSPDPFVEAEQLKTGCSRPRYQRRGEVDRVERPDRLAGKRLPRAIDNFAADSEDVPVCGSGREVAAAIGGVSLCQLAQNCGANQHSIALNHRQIRGDHDFRPRETFTYC